MAGEVRLGEVAEIIMGQSPPGETYNEREDGLPFFQGVADFNYRHPTPRVFCSAPSRIAVPGDILLSVRAPIGRVNVADRKCAIGRGLSIIRSKSQEDTRYLEFALRAAEANWEAIEGGGSVFGNATRRDLEEMCVAWPEETSVRRAIAHILGTLDDKINLNRRMSETLEQMARALFKSWFIDFDPVRRNAARARNQPSPDLQPPSPRGRGNSDGPRGGAGGGLRPPCPRGRGNYRAGYDFSGLVETARALRKKQTPAEAIFWELVRNRRLLGLKFRRQHQIGDYIADFYCHEHRLVIELDGGVHATKRKKDHKRDAWMEAQGFKVLRFPNEQLLDDPESVLSTIAQVVGNTASPFPLGKGRGEGVGEESTASPFPLGKGRGEGVGESTASPLPLGEGLGEGSVEELDRLFPDRFVDSELGPIPEGWEVRPFASTVEILGGGTPKTSVPEYWGGDIPWFSVVDAPNGADVWVVDTEKKITREGLENSSTRILPVATTIISARGTVGRVALVGVPMAMNQSCYGLQGKAGKRGFFTYFATRDLVARLQQHAHGSVFDTITRDTLAGVFVVVPSPELIDAFETTVGSSMERIRAGLFQSRTLAALRDALLPKLIRGEIRVKDAERFLKERGL